MKWTGLNELREKYLSFFESKEHLRLKSFSLVPNNDNSLLLINSGMAPMKKYFTGEITPPKKRVTTCQKCIRTPDIERVGKTARHGTYFEMLGNFSFGDYFKSEATAWAWEFCTKVLELPVDRLWVSIYENDEEAFEIWTKQVGVPSDRIVRLGKADNFWEHGSGPCGPCSEIYFDRGEKYGCGSSDCAVGCDCDRYVEFWNLVFTQFDNDGNNNYTPLKSPNIDTGMGLERLACIMQNVENLFEVDTVQNIMKHISRIAGIHYGDDEKTDVSLRVITDHIRSTVFMVGDGVMPSNEGRGYVLRRLLRRAARHGRLLGIEGLFLSQVVDTVISENKTAYPELEQKSEFIKKLITNEEEAFAKTIDAGLNMLNDMIESAQGKALSGEKAFKLYDTYGFPLDLTRDILEEQGMSVDEKQFDELMKQQRERARAARKSEDSESWASGDLKLDVTKTEFVGYTTLECKTKLFAIVEDGQAVKISRSNKAVLVLKQTPFYAKSGGQEGDIGEIVCENAVFKVEDTTKSDDGIFLHKGIVEKGTFSTGCEVTASVNKRNRQAVMRNHTAGHLLHYALRSVLGSHVEQAGQQVSSDRLRFDFTHFHALTGDEQKRVSAIVNDMILSGIAVQVREMPIEKAKQLGAIALFGEKYSDIVRVVQAGNSVELCGGTHVSNTGNIGLFRIVSEGSVASGVRRIEAVTGEGVLEYLEQTKDALDKACSLMKAGGGDELLMKINHITAQLKQKEQELYALETKSAASRAQRLLEDALQVKDVQVIAAVIKGADAGQLRNMCDSFRDKNTDIVAILAGVNEDKVTFASCCGDGAVKKGAHAGNLVREVAKLTGGNGGGRPDSAMAGGKDASKLDEAIAAVHGIVLSQL